MTNTKGQSLAEYSILIAVVIAAAMAMQTYVKRGLQGRIKDAVDHTGAAQDVGESTLAFSGDQYEPYYIESIADANTSRDYKERINMRGQIERTGIVEETRRLKGAYEIIKDTREAD